MLNVVLVRVVLCSLLLSVASTQKPKADDFVFAPVSSPGIGPAPTAKPSAAKVALVALATPHVAAIADWVSRNVDIPASAHLPAVEIVSPERFATVIYRRLVEDQERSAISELRDQPTPNQLDDVVAFYEKTSRTIFLREGWTGNTPTEVSVLVHEMVHHLQSMAGLKYGCPAEAEELAYAAQQKWLEQHGRDFFEAFGTDRLTLLVRTNCGY